MAAKKNVVQQIRWATRRRRRPRALDHPPPTLTETTAPVSAGPSSQHASPRDATALLLSNGPYSKLAGLSRWV